MHARGLECCARIDRRQAEPRYYATGQESPGVQDRLMKCLLCECSGWVCENHPDQPREGEHGCGGAGVPCPTCNSPAEGERPRLPPGFKTVLDDEDGYRH